MHSAKDSHRRRTALRLQSPSRLYPLPSLRVPRDSLVTVFAAQPASPTRPMSPATTGAIDAVTAVAIVRVCLLTRPLAGRTAYRCRFPGIPYPIPLAHGVLPVVLRQRQSRRAFPAKSLCATARGLSRRDVPRKQFIALQCDKGTNVSRETSGRGTRKQNRARFLGKSARRRAAHESIEDS